VAYKLRLPPQWTIHPVFHASLLTPFVKTKEHGENYSRPPLELLEGEEQYEVKTIKSHRRHGKRKQLQYLIKWKGYPESDNTWEPVTNLQAPQLIREYHRRHPLNSIKRAEVRRGKVQLATWLPPIKPTLHTSLQNPLGSTFPPQLGTSTMTPSLLRLLKLLANVTRRLAPRRSRTSNPSSTNTPTPPSAETSTAPITARCPKYSTLHATPHPLSRPRLQPVRRTTPPHATPETPPSPSTPSWHASWQTSKQETARPRPNPFSMSHIP
jgi:hypothetical protein